MNCRIPDEYKKAKTNASIDMSMYDLNKQIISQLDPIDKEKRIEHFENMFMTYLNNTQNVYHMLLCRELNYYTLFHRSYSFNVDHFGTVMEEILDNQGLWITANWANEETKEAIEYWIKVKQPTEEEPDKEETYCFILFPYDVGVVEVD